MTDTETGPDMKLVVVGAAGRMGRTLVRIVTESAGVTVHAALEHSASPELGKDAGDLAGVGALGVPVSADARAAVAQADGILDFSRPAVTLGFAELAAQARIVHIIGTTGCSAEDEAAIDAAARHAVVVKSGNMSVGVNLLAALAERVARELDASYDIEILEMHHRNKVDAPSGTALMIGEAAARGRGISLADHAVRGRDGITGARVPGTIGFACLRGGSVVGDHTVIYAGSGERLELRHVAEDRTLFAKGAVRAALWGRGRKPGRYSMADVLGLNA